MDRQEVEKKISEKLREIWEIYHGAYPEGTQNEMEYRWICPNCRSLLKDSELVQKAIFNKFSHKTEYESACPVCGCIGIQLADREKSRPPFNEYNLFQNLNVMDLEK